MDIDHAFKVKINSDSATDDGRDGAMDNSVTTAEEGKTELQQLHNNTLNTLNEMTSSLCLHD